MRTPGMVKPEIPDPVLVVASILGDFRAFDELVRRYRAAVVRTARTVVGPDDAEDVAQDALLLAFKALPSIDDPTRFAPWLMVITRRRALSYNQQQHKHRDGRMALDTVVLEQVGALTEPFASPDEMQEEIDLALSYIPDDYALVLRLHFLDGVPHKRIAAFLDIPISTVKWRIYRGKQLIRHELEHLQPGFQWNAN